MTDENKVYQINLKELIEDYTWKEYKDKTPFLKWLFFRKNRHYIDVRWSHLDFKHKTDVNEREPDSPTKKFENPMDLYVAEYENETDQDQTYTFEASRETTQTTSVSLQETYTLGAETNLSVELGAFSLGASVSGSMSVTNEKGEEKSSTQSWNVNTEIKVPAKRRAVAKLEVKEVTRKVGFTVQTDIRILKKNLPVSIRRVADDKVVWTLWIESLRCIVPKSFLRANKDKITLEDDKPDADGFTREFIRVITNGVFRNVSAREQSVLVEYKALSSRNKETNAWLEAAGIEENVEVHGEEIVTAETRNSTQMVEQEDDDSAQGQSKTAVDTGIASERQPTDKATENIPLLNM